MTDEASRNRLKLQKTNEWDELRTLLVGQEKVAVDRLVTFLENPRYMFV